MITDEDKERVRAATDIVQLVSETVMLKQRGQEFWGCCPFHGEKTPSFHVIPSTGLFKCFGCGAGGDVFGYIMKRENLEFPDAIRFLADRAGIELTEDKNAKSGPKRSRLRDLMTATVEYYHRMLMRGKSEGAAAARSYLSGRGFGQAVCRRWKLGYAPGRGKLVAHLKELGYSYEEMIAANVAVSRNGRTNDRFYERAMFPINDEQGNAIALGGRVIGSGEPKYLNSSETSLFHKSHNLFALDRAKESITASAEVLVVEGYTDVIALHEAGFTNVVAALGTALTLDHVKTLSRFRVRRIVCMFDGDAAGQRAAERCIQYLDKTEANIMAVVLPNGQDPAEYLTDHTTDELRAQLDAAQPLMDFVLSRRIESLELDTPGRRAKALDELAGVLAPLAGSVLLDTYAMRVADTLGFSLDDVRKAIKNKPRETSYDDAKETAQEPANVSEYHATAPLTADERVQWDAERELVCALAYTPDVMRAHADRLAGLNWVDARHEAIAWAILATPQGTTPKEAVAAAEAVVPEAAQIISSGRIATSGNLSAEQSAWILVDTCELYSTKRAIRQMRARLAAQAPEDDTNALFAEATALQKRANELQKKLSSAGAV